MGDDRVAFVTFSAAKGHKQAGALLEGMALELDETSLFEPDRNGASLDALVCSGTMLVIASRPADGFAAGSYRVTLIDGLTTCAPQQTLRFTHWSVAIGAGVDRRTIPAGHTEIIAAG